ncbi:hypothetical protein [Kordia periserrulae]|nr:hypothetical protein [Kordia periserrulae]
MKKIIKNLSVIVLALSFLLVGCTNDQATSDVDNDNLTKSKLPSFETEWEEIGYLKDGEPILTIDTKKALKALSASMKEKVNITEDYTFVYIVSTDQAYNLVFEGKKYRTSFYVEAITTSSKLATTGTSTTLVASRKITCTTSECSSEPLGCAVKYDNGNTGLPYCSPCENGGECTKTDISSDVF